MAIQFDFLKDLGIHVVEGIAKQRLVIPGGDVAKIAVAAREYIAEGNKKFGGDSPAPTQAQVWASDKAIIDYVMGRLKDGKVK